MSEPEGVQALGLGLANQIIELVLAEARRAGVAPLTVVALDASGHVVAVQREDGASMFRLEVAQAKAWGAVGMGCSSRELAVRAADNPNFFGGLAATSGGRFLAQPGAVLVRDASGGVMGAVGASGGTGEQDESCCTHGVSQAGLWTEAR